MANATPQNEPIAIRRTVYFSGNVQGVGFRYASCQVARDFEVTGHVKNLLDGRVEVVAEGLPDEVGRFLDALTTTLKRYIEYSTSTDSTARGTYKTFSVEH